MSIKTAKGSGVNFTYLLFYFIAGILLFLPVLHKNFVSDDFVVLKRVCLERTFWVQGFFRPLSDVTLYINYLLGGFNPVGFNFINILLHCLNTYLLFTLCLKWKWCSNEDTQHRYAFMAGILFLTYPFHNEAVVWMLGRGSSLAATFGITAILIILSGWSGIAKVFGVCGCYFAGLLAYESVIFLPAIILILLIEKKTSSRTYLRWVLAFLITGIAHLLFRYKFSEAVFGSYGEDLLKTPWLSYPGNILKVIVRLIVPPVANSRFFLMMSIIAAFVIVTIVFFTMIKLKHKMPDWHFVVKLLSILGCTLIVPFLFAVSTRTSESDRLLYFPSFFVCCCISFLICRFIQSSFKRRLTFILFCIYNIIFLELNNYNWFKAGNATYSIIQSLKTDTGSNKIFIANLPNEIKGAYVFREGFMDALIVNKIDTSRVSVINKLSKELVTNPDETWIPLFSKTKIFIPPFVAITKGFKVSTVLSGTESISFTLPADSKLYYWDQHKFVLLNEHSIMPFDN